jgi:hypothetical protein
VATTAAQSQAQLIAEAHPKDRMQSSVSDNQG